MWQNWNIPALLAGMQNDVTAVENSLEVTQELEHYIAI
jgi:hypothetical protein